MFTLSCFFLALYFIGRQALGPREWYSSGALPALATCTGTSLYLVGLATLIRVVPLRWAVPMALLLALAAAASLHRMANVQPKDAVSPEDTEPDDRPAPWELVFLGVVALVSFRGYFYDELDHHLPVTLEIVRGLYPPPYPFQPFIPFSYHFGLHLLAATVTVVSGIGPLAAFDVFTVIAAWALIRLAAALGGSSGLRGAGRMGSHLAVMGGGLAWLGFLADIRRLPSADVPSIFALPFNNLRYEPWQVPPIVGYLFQHPMALGMPLWLAFLLLWLGALNKPIPWSIVAGGTILGALGLCQTSLFYFSFPTVIAALFIRGVWLRKEPLMHATGRAVGSLALGAFLYWLASGPTAVGGGHAAWAIRWPPRLGWGTDWEFPGYLEAFGLPYLLGALGLVTAFAMRWEAGAVLGSAAVGAFVAPHIVVWKPSPFDTSKFFVASSLSLGILGGAWLVRLPLPGPTRLRRWFVAVVLVPCVLSPVLFLWIRALGPLFIDPSLGPIPRVLLPPPAGGLDRLVGEWLRSRADLQDVVLTVQPYVTAFSGVPSVAPIARHWDWVKTVDPEGTLEAWTRSADPDGTFFPTLDRLWTSMDQKDLERLRIRWVSIGPEERRRIGPLALEALENPARFARVLTIGAGSDERRLYRVVGDAHSTRSSDGLEVGHRRVAPVNLPNASPSQPVLSNSIGMTLIPVPAGRFVMGSPPGEPGRGSDEEPHQEAIPIPFYIGATEVTQKQWTAVMGYNPSQTVGDDLPVENISWLQSRLFCETLSKREDRKYRLPSETEWEYACRAGTTTAYNDGTDTGRDVGNFDRDYGSGFEDISRSPSAPGRSLPVGSFGPNRWGIYDMHGNVAEWCVDVYRAYSDRRRLDTGNLDDGAERVLRGGAFDSAAAECRSASRDKALRVVMDDNIGFRVVMESPQRK